MAVSETAGKTYDSAEFNKLDEFMNQQQAQMDLIDKEREFQNKKVLQYGLILLGASLTLFLFQRLILKKTGGNQVNVKIR
jgi:energy-converting hydrogenase Eha subunit H